MNARTWRASGDPKRKAGRRFNLDGTAAWVLHCGHPTAHYPWYIEIGGDFCGTFRYLADAQTVAERLANGTLEIHAGEYVGDMGL